MNEKSINIFVVRTVQINAKKKCIFVIKKTVKNRMVFLTIFII